MKRRSVYDMPKAELEQRVAATVKAGLRELRRRARPKWVGSEETDRIIGSAIPTHRKGVAGG